MEFRLTTNATVTGFIQQRQSTVNLLGYHRLDFDVSSEARRELAFAF